MKKKSIVKKVLAAVACVLVLAVLGYEIFSLVDPQVKTQTAISALYKESINVKMFAVRDESFLSTNAAADTVVSIVKDGERVSNGQAIAANFSSDEQASDYMELEKLREELARYGNLNNQQNLLSLDLSKINTEIDVLFYDILSLISSGNIDGLDDGLEKFSDKLTTKQILVNGNIDFSEKISSLRAQTAQLESRLGSVEYIQSEDTGYYVSSADGYENTVDFSKITSLSCEDINQVLSSAPGAVPSGSRGKLIHGYNWYFVGNISVSDSTKVKVGDSVNLLCDNVSRGYIKAEVYHKSAAQGDSVALVLVSNIMDEDIARIRIEDVEIIVSETDGIRINKDAVRVIDGVQGVYVLTGNLISFKRLDLIYTGEDYVISKRIYTNVYEDNIRYVKLYDEIIVEGKNLSDGKIIK